MAKTPGWWRRPPGAVAVILSPLTCIYRMGRKIREWFARPYRAPVPVICVGNATSGGSGKTPSALLLARLFYDEGKRVIIVSRGYKGKIRRCLSVDPEVHSAADVGDEPLLLAQVAPVYIGKNRRKTLKSAARLEPDAIILDDGMQNPTIYKDLVILVESPKYASPNEKLFPSGPYREKRKEAEERADMIFSLHYDDESLQASPPENDKTYNIRAVGVTCALDAALPYFAFAGLGVPEKFFDTLRHAGFTLVGARHFPDHYAYKESDVAELLELAAAEQAILITTEKDWVRLPKNRKKYVRFLPLRLELAEKERTQLTETLQSLISKKVTA